MSAAKPAKTSTPKATKITPKAKVDEEDEWADEMSEASISVASGGDDSFVVDESEESAESSEDDLFDSDSEEEVSRKKHKPAAKPPLAPSSKKVAASKAAGKSDNSATTTPNKSKEGTRVLIPFDGSALKTPGSAGSNGSNPLSAFKQSNHALISPRSASGSPFFGTPGGSPSDNSVHTITPSASTLVLPEGVVGRGSHEHNTFSFLLPENRRDGAGVRLGEPEFNPRTVQVPPRFMQDQTPAMMQWWQFKSTNMDTVLFFKVCCGFAGFYACYIDELLSMMFE